MEYQIYPPKKWIEKKSNLDLNIYSKLLNNYEESDTVFEIIKKNGDIKKLNKNLCESLSRKFGAQIKKIFINKIKSDQLKIMGIIGASEESIILMLTNLLLGAHQCICFEDLSSKAIRQRIEIFKPDIIICKVDLEAKVKSAIQVKDLSTIPIVVINLSDLSNNVKLPNNYFTQYKSNHNLFTLFTSGSTGKPKAIQHGINEYLNYAEYTTHYFFGIKKYSKIFTAVDAGWINGHTYAFYGPLLLGAISVINEIPSLISIPRILGQYLDKIKPDCFYTSVTLLRLIKSLTEKDDNLGKYTKSNFRLNRIGSCGEPLADNVGDWAIKFFSPMRKTIVNTYFQTETGGVLVAPRDEDLIPSRYSSVGKPNKDLGMVLAKDILSTKELQNEDIEPDELLIKNYWNGIFNMVISDKKSNYFTKQGYFRLHDIGYFDQEGYLYIGGRSDDVINVSGHRISTSEIESICLSLDSIKEACVVSAPDKLTGEKLVLFFSPILDKYNIKEIINKIKNSIIEKLTKYHVPARFEEFNELPKTQSGKIMRRIMRSLAEDKSFDENLDYSTLANKNAFLQSKDSFLNSLK